MVENFDIVDANRIGIMGWSHGGMITLMNLFTYPGKYKCGFAGVPVSDVIMRMGYSTDDYRKIFSDEGHIGKTPGRIWRNTNAAHRSGTRKNYKIPCSSIPILAMMT